MVFLLDIARMNFRRIAPTYAGDMASFGDRLSALHARILDPQTGRPYTYRAISQWLGEHANITVSQSYLSQLYSGSRSHPSFDITRGLALFYDVPLDYFAVQDEAAEEVTLRQIDIRTLAAHPLFQRLLTQSKSAAEKTALMSALLEVGERLASATQRPRD